MLVDIATLLVNAVLDYFWIFGKLGFPEMGHPRCGAGDRRQRLAARRRVRVADASRAGAASVQPGDDLARGSRAAGAAS